MLTYFKVTLHGKMFKDNFYPNIVAQNIDTCNMASADNFLTQNLLPQRVAQL